MGELGPAHEVIVDSVRHLAEGLAVLDRDMAQARAGDTSIVSRIPGGYASLQEGRAQMIGGLCYQLRSLEEMIIPEDKLDKVVAALEEIAGIYNHTTISVAAENLAKRRTATVGQ